MKIPRTRETALVPLDPDVCRRAAEVDAHMTENGSCGAGVDVLCSVLLAQVVLSSDIAAEGIFEIYCSLILQISIDGEIATRI